MSRVLEKHPPMCSGMPAMEEGRMSSEERRLQLIRAAISLFSQRGFSGTTTKEIARVAGVTEAIVFRHFPTKEALYAAILDYKANEAQLEEWIEEAQEFVDRRDDEALFRSLIRRFLEHHRMNREFTRLMFYSALERHQLASNFRDKLRARLDKFLYDYITLRQREGAFVESNPGAICQALLALPIFYSLDTWLFEFNRFEITEEEAVETFTQLLLKGLRKDTLKTHSRVRDNQTISTGKSSQHRSAKKTE